MTRLGLQLLLAVATAAPLAPQTVSEACSATTSPVEAVRCTDVALGLQAAQGDLALLNAGGVDLAGAASTLGKRVGSGPRYSASGKIALVTFEGPDLRSSSAAPAPGRSAVAPAIQGAFGLGVFRGFSPTPTVGGVLAVDLLATGSLLFPPGSLGYSGPEFGYGLGVRIGVFRESFTLPGITLTATQRWVQGVDLDVGSADGRPLTFGTSTTSLRGLIGKDLGGLGFLAGVGWDRSGSDGDVPIPEGGTREFNDVTNERTLLFGGVSWSYFVVQLSGEAGWASGWSGPASRESAAYDPSSSRFFGALSVRLIY